MSEHGSGIPATNTIQSCGSSNGELDLPSTGHELTSPRPTLSASPHFTSTTGGSEEERTNLTKEICSDSKPFDGFALSTIVGALAFGFTMAALAIILAVSIAVIPFWRWFEEREDDRRNKGRGG